ncbi:hypothetical protein Tco_1157335 [Tanacetum coccineum]
MRNNPQLQQDDLPIWLALKYKFERLHVATTPCRPSAIHPRDQDDPHDDAHSEEENSAKRQKTSVHGTFMFGESSSGQDFKSEPGPSMSGNQEQLDDFYLWMDSYVTYDDEIPNEKVSQELVDEMSHTVDEAKLCKFPVVIFPDNDIEERTSRWVDKYVKKFNPYAPYNVKYWKHPHVGDYAETGLLWSLSVFIRSTVIWERVHDFQLGVESYQQKVNLTAPIITFLGIKKFKVFSIVSELVYGIIYKNIKKEKRVMRH